MFKNFTETTAETFDQDIRHETLPVVVDFWAPWCAPCKMLAPMMDLLASQHEGKAVFLSLNCEEQKDVARKLNIRGIPRIHIYWPGEEEPVVFQNKPAPLLLNQVTVNLASHNGALLS